MQNDGTIRMYSRSKGGDKRSRSLGSGSGSSTPSSPESPSSPSPVRNASAAPRREDESETRRIVEKYNQEMGVSAYALRAMFRSTKFSELKRLDKHITTAQLARISSYSRESRKGLGERLSLANPANMEGYLLEFALTVRPIDTLIEFIDLNQDDADLRAIRTLIAEEDVLEHVDLPDDSRLAEIISSYQTLLQSEVDLLTGANQNEKKNQIRVIAQHAHECFEKVRALIEANKVRGAASTHSGVRDNQQSVSMPPQEEPTGTQRITKQTMVKYNEDRDIH